MPGHVLEILLEIRRQDLGRQPALREDDHLQVAAQELARDAPRFGEVRAADAELAIDDRRIDEDEDTSRRAARRSSRPARTAARPAARRARAGLAIVADEQMNCGFDP